MTKSDLAEALVDAASTQGINDKLNSHLLTVIETAFSALGTSDPAMALEAIEQLYAQRTSLAEFRKQRSKERAVNIRVLKSKLPVYTESESETEEN